MATAATARCSTQARECACRTSADSSTTSVTCFMRQDMISRALEAQIAGVDAGDADPNHTMQLRKDNKEDAQWGWPKCTDLPRKRM